MKDTDYQLVEMLVTFAKSGNCKYIQDGSTKYFYFSWKLIPNQFPQWNIGKTACYNRLNRLISLQLINRHPEGKSCQGYYSICKDIKTRLPRLGKSKGDDTKHADQMIEKLKEIGELSKRLADLEKLVKNQKKQITSDAKLIKQLYETIQGQESLIRELGSQDSTSPPIHEQDLNNTRIQQCVQVFESKYKEHSKQVNDITSQMIWTRPEEKQLKKLVQIIEDQVQGSGMVVDDAGFINEFTNFMDGFISVAPKLWCGKDCLPSNIVRNINSIINNIKIQNQSNHESIESNPGRSSSTQKQDLERELERRKKLYSGSF